jgi:RNA polymerase sigma-70 factor (ECF subfamily)
MIRTAIDPLLVRWCAERDEAAFRGLVEAYGPLVRRICRRVLRSDLAEDAVQETFLRLSRQPRAVDDLGGWLYRTALNAAIDQRRSERARREREQGWGREQAAVDHGEPPAEHEFLLEQCLARLSAEHRALLADYFWQGRTQADIAERHGVSQPAVKKRLDRAIAALRLELLRHGFAMALPAAAVGAPCVLPAGLADIAGGLGLALLAMALLRPRQAWQRFAIAVAALVACVGQLMDTSAPTRPGVLPAAMRAPAWLRSARIVNGAMVGTCACLAVLLGPASRH